MTHKEILKSVHPKELQEAELFAIRFQASARCKSFRSAWGIEEGGFKTHRAYEVWQEQLNERSNKYARGRKYQALRKQFSSPKILAEEFQHIL